jgi:hypothetical protein
MDDKMTVRIDYRSIFCCIVVVYLIFAGSHVFVDRKAQHHTHERQALEDILSKLAKELESSRFFVGMEQPDLGDLTVFGTLRAIEGLPVHTQ